MSAKVRLLEIGQSISDSRRNHVKKSVADLLIRRLLAEQVGPGVIRLIAVKSPSQHVKGPSSPRHYIPVKMPPREVPGVFFQPPQSDQWKLAHRSVTF